ncbi:MAG: hypothetical protein KF851_03805 [Pirellulaceae bacterium]|nr:hypothetical protein [Pirellulaceae bacterium]
MRRQKLTFFGQNGQPFIWRVLIFGLAASCVFGEAAFAQPDTAQQQDPMAIAEEVNDLEIKLSSESIPDREAAQARLIALGPAVLDLLPPINGEMPTDLQTRLRAIRRELEIEIAKSIGQSSKVTLTGTKDLDQVLEQIKKQTGNAISAVQVGDGSVDVECDWTEQEFWKVIGEILKKNKLTIDKYSGDGQEIVLVPKRVSGLQNVDQAADRFQPIMSFGGIIAMEVERVDSSLVISNPELSSTSIEVTVRWEPRLQPVEIDIPYSEMVLTDDLGTIVAIPGDGSISFAIPPEFASTEVSIRLPILSLDAKRIKSLEGVCKLRVPGRRERFEFREVDRMAPGEWQERASSQVKFQGLRKNDDLFQLRVELSFLEGSDMLESHQSWAIDNPAYLLDGDGTRINPIGLETYRQSGGALGVGYLFLEVPEGATFVYETPSTVVSLESSFSLENIPLR